MNDSDHRAEDGARARAPGPRHGRVRLPGYARAQAARTSVPARRAGNHRVRLQLRLLSILTLSMIQASALRGRQREDAADGAARGVQGGGGDERECQVSWRRAGGASDGECRQKRWLASGEEGRLYATQRGNNTQQCSP
jgi:hypothetical protein